MNMNPTQLMQQISGFRQQMLQQNPDLNPQEYIQKMMNEGKISQQQFEQARNFAGMFGMKL